MVTSLIKAIIDKDEDIVVKPEPLILVDAFGDSSINIMIRFWVESSSNWQKIRSNLANRIKKAFDEVGVNIPFPIRTLKLDEDDRSFLKTMDSMKKGMVPEPKAVPSNEQIASAAGNTEKAQQIPYSVFDMTQRTGQVVSAEEMKPAAAHPEVAHKINPAPGHEDHKMAEKEAAPAATTTPPQVPAAQQTENPVKQPPQTEVGSDKGPTVTPPPTHL